jgi:NAD(P)-dependent dehydrogenase (short-subunit alcohol dehydrogenase family)
MTNGLDRALVVTGASTGIGRAAVAKAVASGSHVFPAVRKAAAAKSLKAEFGEAVTPLIFDVTDEAAVKAAAVKVGKALGGRRLFGLLNNAGMAVPGPLLHLTTADLRHQMEVNFTGVHIVTQAFLPLLGTDAARTGSPGRIVMISSVGGETAVPFIGAYAASKHALEGYSEALRRELILFGIDVIVIAPGAIATPIWDKVDEDEIALYRDTRYGPMLEKVRDFMLAQGRKGLPPAAVGDLVWKALSKARPKVRYRILRGEFFQITLPKFLPARLVDHAIARTLGLLPPK